MSFQERVSGIEQEVQMVDASLGEFLSTVTTDFNGLIGKIDQMKDNMSQLKQESHKSANDLEIAMEHYTPSPAGKNTPNENNDKGNESTFQVKIQN